MSFRKFQLDDRVMYVGSKFAKELNGKVGIVNGTVAGTDTGVVIDFGESDAYIMDEKHLAIFQGKPKDAQELKEESKGTEVSKRRPKRRVEKDIKDISATDSD